VYNLLHQSGALSYYVEYRELGAQCRRLFEQRDHEELRRLLCRTRKYRYVIEHVTRESKSSHLLEVGCSRGYLTSYFILEGRNILGVDASSDAVEDARAAFGDHFALADSLTFVQRGTQDLVYHVGTIGCVDDPLGLTRRLLATLKPGGR
jgi:trans-aconitate methyltransferase